MRTILILAMFAASLANAGWQDYVEERELQLDAAGVDSLTIDVGAGSLTVAGVDGVSEISVVAVIHVPGKNEEKAKRIIERHMLLTLEKNGSRAMLTGRIDSRDWGWGDSERIDLVVQVPKRLDLDVEDSSGSITVNDVAGDIVIDDSSGSIRMSDVGGSIDITDSSGSINVRGVGEDISVDDGSGSIVVRDVTGSVIVDDGSGSVTVNDVGRDLIIRDAGSGAVNYSNVQGRVQNDG